MWAFFFPLKPFKVFRIVPSKQPRLVKPCLTSDLHFIFKTSGTAIQETIFSFKPPLSLSQENRDREALPPALLDTSKTTFISTTSSILNCSWANQMNLIMNRRKYRSKKLLKTIFLSPKR